MPLLMRQRLRNHFLVGLVLFGAEFVDFIKPLIQQMRKLQDRIIMTNCNSKRVLVSRGLSMCTSNLPQANDMAGQMTDIIISQIFIFKKSNKHPQNLLREYSKTAWTLP
ncbi:18776_t:CDS:2 [Funneliformis geosporum]|uniref:18776_t:CDS:1 n=1 Tax=Funneliformis geosporum TaxID=1117311 RepID=A0A9W4WWB2_9GLOM|nr:18776_t:CDS:2 [Funneliformis geosporum]